MSSLLFPLFKLSRENAQLENMWHNFWKGERCLWRSNHPKRSLKKVLWGISQNWQENISFRIFFSNKVKLCRSAASLKTRSSAGVFLRICKIHKKTFFAEHHQTTTSDYSSINSISNEVKIRKRNCKLWYKNHVPIWATSVTY